MNPIWESTFKIRAFDVDLSGRLKVNSILDYCQDAASHDAERLHFGYTDFVPRGLVWVLSWVKFEFSSFPGFMDEIKIQSWGKKQFKLYSMRDYLLINSKDEIICKGTSAWLLLDSKSFRPKIFPQLFPEIKMYDSKDALTDLPQKIFFPKHLEKKYNLEVRYSDIDLNQHTNNAKYIELMLDCFDEDFHKTSTIKTLTVSFNSETKFGDKIEMFKSSESENPSVYYIEAKNSLSGKSVFQAIVEWN
jgi:acyl-ACP thioesterase